MRSKLLLILLATTAFAQSEGRSFGYAFAATVFVPKNGFTRWNARFLQGGLGGEIAIKKRASVGGEVGALVAPFNRFAAKATTGTVGGSFHPLGSAQKLAPFLSGGAGVLAANGTGGIIYFGGGLNYWPYKHIGFRTEYRHYYYPVDGGITFAGVRLGITFH
jgi:hypothetical protein